MNSDFFGAEFRNFKYLKSNPFFVKQYKGRMAQINSIQPFSTPNDLEFVWPHRVEFLEQLINLHDSTVYIIYPGPLDKFGTYDPIPGVESVSLYEIVNPVIYEGNVLQPALGNRAVMEDIENIENAIGTGYCLCSLEYFSCPLCEVISCPVFKLDRTFLFSAIDYSAIFYDKSTAIRYKNCLSEFLRKTHGAVSALSRLF